MFWFVAYFAVLYGGLIFLLVAASQLLRKSKMSRRLKIAALVVAPLLPYARVSAQTALFQRALMPAFRAASTDLNGGWQAPTIFRILSVSSSRATVYAVNSCSGVMGSDAKNDAIGETLEFKKTRDKWQFTGNYDTIWSDCGSAEGNTFPPYPEAKSF